MHGSMHVQRSINSEGHIMHQYGDCVYYNNHEAPMAAMGIPEFTITNQMWYYNLYF